MAPSRTRVALIVATWLAIGGGGTIALARYSGTPGGRGITPSELPADLRGLCPDATRPTLFLLIHPRCPCTHATLAELDRIVARARAFGGLDVEVLYFVPEGATDAEADGWGDTRIVALARAIPGARVHADPGARRAAALGAHTSGHAVLYDLAGRLRFSGGLTAARGHEDPSPAHAAILAVLDGRTVAETESAAFGCPLSAEPPPAATAAAPAAAGGADG